MILIDQIFKKHTGNSINQEEYAAIIEIVKLHCIEQARVIAEKALVNSNGETYTNYSVSPGQLVYPINIIADKDSILSAYSLDNIK